MRRRVLKPLVYVVLVLAFIGALLWGFSPKPLLVDAVGIQRGAMRVTVDEDGKTRIKEKYVVAAPLSGRLLRIDLHVGDVVQAGSTLLCRIEPTDPNLLDTRERLAGQSRVRAAEANVEKATASLERSQAALDLAQAELSRAEQLAVDAALAQEQLEERRTRYRVSEAEHKADRFALEIAEFELQQARAALVRSDPDIEDAGYAPHFDIRSPINGCLLRIFQESSTIVQPGVPLLEIGDPLDLEVEIDVLSADAVKIKPGAVVTFEHWGGEKPLAGIVRVVEPSAFTKISALGVEEQRTNVIVDLTDPPDERKTLGDGFGVDARIDIWNGDNVLKVPIGAIFRDGAQWAVFAIQQGRARLKPVELGHRNESEAEVLQGLSVGDQVILHPSDRIQSGVRIKVRPLATSR